MASYIRAKRATKTIFLYVDANDSIAKVQEKIAKLVHKAPEEVRLVSGGVALDPAKTVADARLDNDAVVHFVFKTESGWEDPTP